MNTIGVHHHLGLRFRAVLFWLAALVFAQQVNAQALPSITLSALQEHRGTIAAGGTGLRIFNPDIADAEYLLVPMNLDASAALPLTVGISGNVATAAGSPGNSTPQAADPRIARRQALLADFLTRKGGVDASAPLNPPAAIPGGQQPHVGDAWQLNADLGNQCSPGLGAAGTVYWVGNHIAVVMDGGNPVSGMSLADWQATFTELDTVVYPTIAGKFGQPSDLDGNGKVVVFITQGVNKLAAPASSNTTASLYLPRDKLSRQECATSNLGEIIYVLAPDPTGAVNSNVRTVSYVQGVVPPSFARELAHLIVDGHRMASNSPFEEAWLDEALGNMAVEQVFYARAPGIAPFNNINLANLTTGPSALQRVDAFNTYVNTLYGPLRTWLQFPSHIGVLDGGKKTLSGSGSQWAFLRYVADRHAGPSVSDEAAFIQALAGSSLTGLNNLQNAIGADPREWLEDYLISAYVDDSAKAGALGVSGKYAALSWNYRSVYGGLGGFPIKDIPLPADGTASVTLNPQGSSNYYRFQLAPDTMAQLSLTPAAGSPNGRYALIRLNNPGGATAVTKKPQTITFPNPGQQHVGVPLVLSASAESGLDVAFGVSGACSLDGGTLTVTFHAAGVGACTVTASQAGNGAWLPAQVSHALNVQAVAGPPGAPTGVAATPGDGVAAVQWAAPTDTGGSAITGYTVTASGPPGRACTTTGALACTVAGLTNGTAYTFTVMATNATGHTSGASQPSQPVIPVAAPAPPGAPTGVAATPGDGVAAVQWAAPTSTGGSAITGYTVTASGPPGRTCTTTGALACTVAGLTNGTAYTFTVVATNATGHTSGASQPSQPVIPVRRSYSDALLTFQFTGGGAGCTLDSAQSLPAAAVTGLPAGVQASGPQLGFKLTGCDLGGVVQVQIDYGANLPGPAAALQYWKRDSAMQWAAYGHAQIAGNRVTLTLTDGGDGDADGAQNNEIVDPGVVVLAAAAAPQAIPTLSQWGLILMALVLSVFGLQRLPVERNMLSK
ncbi:IPTL-CTERM sorting domain-containing protein [Acidovorax sp. SDU_ACID1]|uniref:IPTL-CTERM sorting domain-containing protein n=1 Tax=Acidovorax sp. SDU_ACID1 TaxID=3136632 RepID=UPI003872CD5D